MARDVAMASNPVTARGPEKEAPTGILWKSFKAVLIPILGSTWGGSGEAPDPPDLVAIIANGKALFARRWLDPEAAARAARSATVAIVFI